VPSATGCRDIRPLVFAAAHIHGSKVTIGSGAIAVARTMGARVALILKSKKHSG
jgi:hypothetical protein